MENKKNNSFFMFPHIFHDSFDLVKYFLFVFLILGVENENLLVSEYLGKKFNITISVFNILIRHHSTCLMVVPVYELDQ